MQVEEWENGWGADWSLGEIVVKGIHSDQHRMEIESYLGKIGEFDELWLLVI